MAAKIEPVADIHELGPLRLDTLSSTPRRGGNKPVLLGEG